MCDHKAEKNPSSNSPRTFGSFPTTFSWYCLFCTPVFWAVLDSMCPCLLSLSSCLIKWECDRFYYNVQTRSKAKTGRIPSIELYYMCWKRKRGLAASRSYWLTVAYGESRRPSNKIVWLISTRIIFSCFCSVDLKGMIDIASDKTVISESQIHYMYC